MAAVNKTLILVRHAKSSWNNPGLSDEERPLNTRGERDAPRMGDWLSATGIQPDLMVASPAQRARSTAVHIARALGRQDHSIVIDQQLYFTGVHGMLRAIEAVDDANVSLMMVGHNPVMTQLFNQLSGEQLSNMPTCGMGILTFDMPSWGLIDSTPGRLQAFQTPKGLAKAP